MKEAQTVTDFADASHSKSAKSTATTVLYGIFRSEISYLCAMTKHVQYTLLLYIRKATVYNNYRSFAVGYCSRLAQTVTDFADASHSKSAKSTTTTVLYGIFSSENSYPCTVTIFSLRDGKNSQNKLTYPCPKNIILLLRKEKTLENLRQSAYYGERRREIAR